jgi:hypothetical protein
MSKVLHSGGLIEFVTIGIARMRVTLTNAPAYCTAALTTAEKSFILLASTFKHINDVCFC